ncbi:Myosin-D [Frankliniella fusca]|uniref:Myosin-D n=1 Tax=Frankliniella fusca TaxID=407009 RepID=A0AAE1I1A9_9NEOP|nr:Myosin-D [Frankliniella fusca]
MASEDLQTPTWAYVKFADNYGSGVRDVVKVKKIRERKVVGSTVSMEAFLPENITDFEKSTWYSVKTEKGTKSQKEEWFWALIGKLAVNRDDLMPEALGRISFPPVPPPESEPESSESEEPLARQSAIQEAKVVRRGVEKNKRTAENKDYDEYMSRTQIVDEFPAGQMSASSTASSTNEETVLSPLKRHCLNSTGSSTPSSEVATSANSSVDTCMLNSMLTMFNDMKSQILQDFKSEMAALNQKVDTVVQENVRLVEALEGLTAKVSESTRSSVPSTVADGGVQSPNCDMVPWGDVRYGVTISKYSVEAMNRVRKDSEWITLFLEGVYKDHSVIPHLRVRKQKNSKEETVVIDKNIMMVAKAQYRQWLESHSVDMVEIDRRVNNFGGKVGDVCTDRGRARSLEAKVRQRQRAGEDVSDLVQRLAHRRRRSSEATARARLPFAEMTGNTPEERLASPLRERESCIASASTSRQNSRPAALAPACGPTPPRPVLVQVPSWSSTQHRPTPASEECSPAPLQNSATEGSTLCSLTNVVPAATIISPSKY